MTRYGAIVADPPWSFENWSEKGEDRNASQHYSCMSLKQLTTLPVSAWAAEDCALFLWVLDPMLPQGLELMKAWGFTFKTVAFYWVKLKAQPRNYSDYFMGLGYWTRANPEMCLLGTRGSPKRLSKAVRKLIVAPRREHSRKPEDVYKRVEHLVAGPYLDLFSRASRPGWDGWGAETGQFDTRRLIT